MKLHRVCLQQLLNRGKFCNGLKTVWGIFLAQYNISSCLYFHPGGPFFILFFAFIDDDFMQRLAALFFSNFSHDMANQDAILYHQTETKSMSHEFHVDPLIMRFRSWCYSINSDCHLGQQWGYVINNYISLSSHKKRAFT